MTGLISKLEEKLLHTSENEEEFKEIISEFRKEVRKVIKYEECESPCPKATRVKREGTHTEVLIRNICGESKVCEKCGQEINGKESD